MINLLRTMVNIYDQNVGVIHVSEAQAYGIGTAKEAIKKHERDEELSRQTKQLFQLLDKWAEGEVTSPTLQEAVRRRRSLQEEKWNARAEERDDAKLARRRRGDADPDTGSGSLRDGKASEDGAVTAYGDPRVQASWEELD
jgi:hypothetical protein